MTEFFSYEILTWPEVAGLPRAMPLILPLGQGYPFEPLVAERLADALADFDLGHPERVGILPAFPYGWVGSGLPVPESILEALIANLLNSLRDDGFARVYALTPQGPPQGTLPGLGASRIVMPLAGSPDPFWLLPLDENRSKVVLIPVGHTEQHAYHLPLSTDTLIIEAIAQGVAQAIPEQAIVLPIMPYGVSTHRASFAGTLNAGGRAFEDFYLSVMDVLVGRGYERAYLLSGTAGIVPF